MTQPSHIGYNAYEHHHDWSNVLIYLKPTSWGRQVESQSQVTPSFVKLYEKLHLYRAPVKGQYGRASARIDNSNTRSTNTNTDFTEKMDFDLCYENHLERVIALADAQGYRRSNADIGITAARLIGKKISAIDGSDLLAQAVEINWDSSRNGILEQSLIGNNGHSFIFEDNYYSPGARNLHNEYIPLIRRIKLNRYGVKLLLNSDRANVETSLRPERITGFLYFSPYTWEGYSPEKHGINSLYALMGEVLMKNGINKYSVWGERNFPEERHRPVVMSPCENSLLLEFNRGRSRIYIATEGTSPLTVFDQNHMFGNPYYYGFQFQNVEPKLVYAIMNELNLKGMVPDESKGEIKLNLSNLGFGKPAVLDKVAETQKKIKWPSLSHHTFLASNDI